MVDVAGVAPTNGLLASPDLHAAFSRFVPRGDATVDLEGFADAAAEILMDEAEGFDEVPV
jgi:hypothetical protein